MRIASERLGKPSRVFSHYGSCLNYCLIKPLEPPQTPLPLHSNTFLYPDTEHAIIRTVKDHTAALGFSLLPLPDYQDAWGLLHPF